MQADTRRLYGQCAVGDLLQPTRVQACYSDQKAACSVLQKHCLSMTSTLSILEDTIGTVTSMSLLRAYT